MEFLIKIQVDTIFPGDFNFIICFIRNEQKYISFKLFTVLQLFITFLCFLANFKYSPTVKFDPVISIQDLPAIDSDDIDNNSHINIENLHNTPATTAIIAGNLNNGVEKCYTVVN